MNDGSVMLIARMPEARSSMFHLDTDGKLLEKTPMVTRDHFYGMHHLDGGEFAWFEMARKRDRNLYFKRGY